MDVHITIPSNLFNLCAVIKFLHVLQPGLHALKTSMCKLPKSVGGKGAVGPIPNLKIMTSWHLSYC